MNGKIISRGRIMLLGLSFFGDPFNHYDCWEEENEIGRLWKRFMAFLQENKAGIQQIKDEHIFYGVHLENSETRTRGMYEVFTGIELKQMERIPLQGLVKILPASEYAVFTLAGAQIATDWARDIYAGWLPESGYEKAYPFGFNLYDHRFKGMEKLDESQLDVYIPVNKK